MRNAISHGVTVWKSRLSVIAILTLTSCGGGAPETSSLPGVPLRISVTLAGDGLGSVRSAPAGIDCGADCAENYGAGTVVVLSATPQDGSRFAGWGGCDEVNAATCIVRLPEIRAVTATFELLPPPNLFSLVVNRVLPRLEAEPRNYVSLTLNNGIGAITSDPAGISCPPDCTEDFPEGAQVLLTAAAGENSAFSGWIGCDQGDGEFCAVTMGRARQVAARFTDEQEHTEPDVRVNPFDPNHVVVTWMQKPAGGADLNNCALATTFDRGQTWSHHLFTKLAHVACADISVAFGPPGVKQMLYATSIGYGAPGGIGDGDGVSTYTPSAGLVGQIYLFKSDDGGLTWSAPTVVYDSQDPRNPAAFDRPWVEVDLSDGPFHGRIYVSAMTVFVQQATPRIYLKYSDDGGQTFSPPIEVDRLDGDAGRSTAFATLDVGPDGHVMMVYRSWPFGVADEQPEVEGNLADLLHGLGVPEHPNGFNRPAERSGEGFCAACFSSASIQFAPESLDADPDGNFMLVAESQRPYTIARTGLPFVNRSGEERNSEEGAAYATVAADPTTPGRFAAVYGDLRYSREAQANDFNHVPPGQDAAQTPTLDSDISFTWTDDWGAHWSRPVRVNDDLIGSGVIQDRAWLSFDPVTGLPVVAWRDRRHSGAGLGVMSDLYAARLLSFGRRDWGDAPQSVSQPQSVNQRRYADAPRFEANSRLSSPIEDEDGGGFTPRSSLSDSFFSLSVAGDGQPGPVSTPGTLWAVWAPIVISRGNGTVPDEVADLESGLRQVVLRLVNPGEVVDLTPYNPLD